MYLQLFSTAQLLVNSLLPISKSHTETDQIMCILFNYLDQSNPVLSIWHVASLQWLPYIALHYIIDRVERDWKRKYHPCISAV